MKLFLKITISFLVLIFFFSSLVWYYLGPASQSEEDIIFTIPQDLANYNLVNSLFEQGLIKNKTGFEFLIKNYSKVGDLKPGGYKLKPSLYSWEVVDKLKGKQDLMWVNIFFCPRKEQVGEKLATTLGWDQNKLNKWNNLYKNTDYYEGVYYPDTYLIPVDESVEEVAKRFINRFNEKFKPLESEYIDQNIKWTTGLKIASLIAREAAGREDMRLISAVIWNRLNQDMRLQIDATMQYTLGKNEDGSWWGSIDLDEKQKDSPYNSYRNEGLPPTAICSPNIEFIEAVLYPEESDCLFYLHDKNKKIYCAETYEEHKENINNYLR